MINMNKIGRKIYFDIKNGETILDTGERMGSVVATSIERDIEIYTSLSERNRDTFDVLELPYGQYAQDFAESNGYQVDLETKTLEFSYPDPNEPEAPLVYQAPLSEKVAILELAQETTNTTILELMEMVLLS